MNAITEYNIALIKFLATWITLGLFAIVSLLIVAVIISFIFGFIRSGWRFFFGKKPQNV